MRFDQVHVEHFYQWIFVNRFYCSTVSGLQCKVIALEDLWKNGISEYMGGAAGKFVDIFHWQVYFLCINFFFSSSIIYNIVTKEILVVCRAYFHDVGVWILSLGLLHYCMYILIKIEMSQSGRKSETPKSNEQMVDSLNGLTSTYYQIRLL